MRLTLGFPEVHEVSFGGSQDNSFLLPQRKGCPQFAVRLIRSIPNSEFRIPNSAFIRGVDFMLNIKIIATGDFKENYLREACAEYKKRLGAWCKLEEIILKEERLPENPSQAQIDKALEAEAKRIFEKISPRSYVIAMCVEGKQLSSEELAEKIEQIQGNGISEIALIIGSSFGLSPEEKSRADYKLSISKLTFPHQLLRVILHEAVYRALSIINGAKYHK